MAKKPSQMKTFVIDTNVLIHKPDAILSFKDNEIVIPLQVLEELDKLKTFHDEKGRSARSAIRFFDEIGKKGDLGKGVRIENGSILKIIIQNDKKNETGFSLDKNDNKIILTAYSLHKQGRKVFFVSKDINARVKATALGLKAVDYEKQKVDFMSLYNGYIEMEMHADTFHAFQTNEQLHLSEKLNANQFVIVKEKNSKSCLIGRFHPEDSMIRQVAYPDREVCGIYPLNLKQAMVMDILLDDSIALVTIVGKAGTGKTLLALAAGLKKVIEEKKYTKLLVSRPVIPMGKDIGYLPGAKSEKLSPWMQPLFDNLEHILNVYKKPNIKSIEQLLQNKTIEIEALTYIRGRSLPGQFIIIDEAQNLSPHEVKTIVSRAGIATKVILTGDPYQIDNPYLDANSNGLSYLVEAFKGNTLFGHVTLEKSERSALAEFAAELL